MKRIMDQHQLKTWISFLLLAAAIIVVYHIVSDIGSETSMIFGIFNRFFNIIAPFVWGFMFAYVLNIPREKLEYLLEKTGNPFVVKRMKGLSVLLTYTGLVVVILILSNLVFPRIYESITDFAAFLSTSLIYDIENFLIELDQNDAIPFFNLTSIAGTFTFEDLFGFFNVDNITLAFNTIMSFSAFIFRAALSIISSVYFIMEGERIKIFALRLIRAFISGSFYRGFIKYGREINTYFKRYIFCQVLDAVILGTIMTIVMSLMGISYAFTLGPLLGVANLIPYFGSIVGTIVSIIVIMFTDGFQFGLIATIVLLIVQQIDANFIFPRLLGGSMKIPPLLVIVGIAVGGAYYGILGMIMAIPIATVLRNIVDDILKTVEAKKAANKGGELR